jgi:type II secretory pathway component HofQ
MRAPIAVLCFVAALANATAFASPSRAPGAARVTVRAQNEPVRSVLLRIAHDSGANISVGSDVTGYVTVELHAVTVPQALDAVLTPLGDRYRLRQGGVVL